MKKIVGFMSLISVISFSCMAMEAPISKASERQVEAQKILDANLIRAIRAQNATQVRQLLANGANIYSKDESGKTALEIAGDTANAEIVGLLYAKVEKKKPETLFETLPKELQQESAKYAVVGIINESSAPDQAINKILDRGLQKVIDKAWIGQEIKKKFNTQINTYMLGNETLLGNAIKRNNTDEVEILLRAGANPDQVLGRSEVPPLMKVFDNIAIVRLLLDAGADVNKDQTYGKNTPLHVAASSGNLDAVKALLGAKADVNKQNEVGYTPLHSAASSGNLEVVKALLDAGADKNIIDRDGRSPLQVAGENGYSDIAKLLR